MKFALIIPDGCADEPQSALGGRTPLQAATIPQMDAIAAAGSVGLAATIPASLPAGSDVGTMSLFGYDPLVYHTGRAPIEAAAQGIELGLGDWAIRCNLVTIADGLMKSFTAEQIPSDAAAELIGLMQRDQCGAEHWKFHQGVSYRNLLIYRARQHTAPFSAETLTVPPHDILDQPVNESLPRGPGCDALKRLMARSAELFAQCDVNRRREEAGEKPATQIWLWGQGQTPQLPPFQQRFGICGAVITAVDLLRGMGRLLGWKIVDVPGTTGYLDTDFAAKGQYAIDELAGGVDLIVVHVEATDEASHEGNAAAKVAALESIDREIVGPIHAYLKSSGDYRIAVSPDHPTLLRTRTHSHGKVPFAICGTGVATDSSREYDESTAAVLQLDIRGHELMPLLLS
ncbi:MAG: cofactor-independent phosphoglycerate mutase [Planctomycetes bacterium]|nr:cofactor-independent phosphoglycerate mutase [Planctomycetota bacterium]